MDANRIAHEIDYILRNELDDVERALKAGDTAKALRELDDAVRKLKNVAHQVRRLRAAD